MDTLTTVAIYAGVIFLVLIVIAMTVTRLYRRASKEIGFVRTGFGGERVVMNGGALVLPVLHETMPVNMNTVRLAVQRRNADALITLDRLRIDVQAEFYVRVRPDAGAIAMAAQTLGLRTMQPEALKDLVEGKFVDALRSVAAGMTMNQLHEQRADFVQKVQQVSSSDLAMNGLELESVSLTGLDQTSIEHFNANNAFDAGRADQADRADRAAQESAQRHRAGHARPDGDQEPGGGQALVRDRPRQRVRALWSRSARSRCAVPRRGPRWRANRRSARKRADGARIEAKRLIDAQQIEADRQVEEARISQRPGARDRPAGAADRGSEQEPGGEPGEGRGRRGARHGGGRRGAGGDRPRERGLPTAPNGSS